MYPASAILPFPWSASAKAELPYGPGPNAVVATPSSPKSGSKAPLGSRRAAANWSGMPTAS